MIACDRIVRFLLRGDPGAAASVRGRVLAAIVAVRASPDTNPSVEIRGGQCGRPKPPRTPAENRVADMRRVPRSLIWCHLFMLTPPGIEPAVTAADPPAPFVKRPEIVIRGIYGGVPTQIFDRGKTLEDFGVNAVWVGSGSVTGELVASLKAKSTTLKIFAEFNTMHDASYLKDHPEARPIDAFGEVSPPPDGWQGVCPTHPGYRRNRMEAFQQVLRTAPIDGIWLDYHHAHASWEQARPNLPDTCFCDRCLSRFQKATGVSLPDGPTAGRARDIFDHHKLAWVQWRCDVFTDWVREFRAIVDRERPGALLGTFHCPWSDADFDHALREKLAIDLKAQARYLDVFSIMTYHARFGHQADPAWIAHQTASLGRLLGIQGHAGERMKIWPIVQLSDWGEPVPVSQVVEVLDQAMRPPASGVMVFVWGTLHPQWDKVEKMGEFYRAAQGQPDG